MKGPALLSIEAKKISGKWGCIMGSNAIKANVTKDCKSIPALKEEWGKAPSFHRNPSRMREPYW